MPTLEITMRYSPFAFLYALFKPNITINGARERRPWGTHRFELPPGTYLVELSYPWLFTDECGKNSVEIVLREGDHKHIRYTARQFRRATAAGAIVVLADDLKRTLLEAYGVARAANHELPGAHPVVAASSSGRSPGPAQPASKTTSRGGENAFCTQDIAQLPAIRPRATHSTTSELP